MKTLISILASIFVTACTTANFITADCDKTPPLPVGTKLYRTETVTDTTPQKRSGASNIDPTTSCKYYYVDDGASSKSKSFKLPMKYRE